MLLSFFFSQACVQVWASFEQLFLTTQVLKRCDIRATPQIQSGKECCQAMVVIIEPEEELRPVCMLALRRIAAARWARLVSKQLILLLYKFQFSSRGQMLKEFKKLRN